ncbi:DUF983 domain-containing protein [Aerophototrophica crusticola]|uniref:DUF983 domain-containing protein n=1 Tax=Aerophototrophica crusticola TaxID=1709002 RepID=A0A858R6L3_9PROT|nr:DUF983 domain-containing protein [Rhodospirillaceae bacterium B3]
MGTDRPDLSVTPFGLGIRGLCPRCHRGHIFDGYLTLAKECDACGLDFSFADPADGPAFFAMSIVSFPVVGVAAWLEMGIGMSVWLNVLITCTLAMAGCMLLLRPLKGWLVCSQYINKAEQARLAEEEEREGSGY